jgi:hypothetical protein
MTMFGILEVVFIALRKGIQIDRLLFEESREEQASLQENIQLTVKSMNSLWHSSRPEPMRRPH